MIPGSHKHGNLQGLKDRGVRTAVCGKNFAIYTQAPYGEQITPVPAYDEVPERDAPAYDCHASAVRDPRETKGQAYDKTSVPGTDCCGSEGCC